MSLIRFSDGLPERGAVAGTNLTEEELQGKKCGGCHRFEERDHGGKGGWHCCGRPWDVDVFPDDRACEDYWDREAQEELDRKKEEDTENRRKELWAIYAEKDPVKLPIVNDGYGMIPMCPVCGEMPYSTEQCHWCGQRFIQDEEVEEYGTPLTEEFNCPNCKKPGIAYISRYNGHKHFRCEYCGMAFME